MFCWSKQQSIIQLSTSRSIIELSWIVHLRIVDEYPLNTDVKIVWKIHHYSDFWSYSKSSKSIFAQHEKPQFPWISMIIRKCCGQFFLKSNSNSQYWNCWMFVTWTEPLHYSNICQLWAVDLVNVNYVESKCFFTCKNSNLTLQQWYLLWILYYPYKLNLLN